MGQLQQMMTHREFVEWAIWYDLRERGFPELPESDEQLHQKLLGMTNPVAARKPGGG